MNYDRFLEIHFNSSKGMAAGPDGKAQYNYDFAGDVRSQRAAYHNKLQKKFNAAFDDIPRMVHLFAELENVRSRPKQANSLHLDETISQGAPPQMRPLDPYHYVSCYVDLESLQPGQPVLPTLESLVKWVCAKQTAAGAPIVGKMRLNCHGSNRAGAGLSMGESSLSPDDLVDALVRHGLGTRAVQNTVTRGVASEPQARWKADAEAKACEKCGKSFTTFTRRHHCRRCGGIFCDACTKQRRTLRDPLTENGRAKGDVKDCRVCDPCAAVVSEGAMAKLGLRSAGVDFSASKVGSGLAQITLALCLTASSREEFADAKTGFIRNSIASRLVRRLKMKGIHGIQVSGSNEVIAWNATGGMVQVLDLKYPGIALNKEKITGQGHGLHAHDDLEGTDWAGPVIEETSMTIPAFVCGARNEPGVDPKMPAIIDDPEFARIRDQRIVPVMGGNRMAFGNVRSKQELELVSKALRKWKMSSWRIGQPQPSAGLPELARANRLGTTLTNISLTRPSIPQGDTQYIACTMVVDAPQRRVTIKRHGADPDRLVVTGFEERRYKDYKICEVS